MSVSTTARRPGLIALLSAALLVAAILLPGSAGAAATTHKPACHGTGSSAARTASSHAVARPRPAAHKCPKKARKTKSTHGKGRRGHRRHGQTQGESSEESAFGGEESAAEGVAVCEDGSAPLANQEGAFSCDDGSEPRCEAGQIITLSSDGSTLLCETPAGEETGQEGQEDQAS
jgi:hypothetical protein